MIAAALAASVLLTAPPSAPPADEKYRQALDVLYDGYTDAALDQLQELQDAHPDDPIASYLYVLGLVWKIEQQSQRTDLDATLQQRLDAVLARTAATLASHPDDKRALLARGAAFGVRTRFEGFRGRLKDSARAAKAMRAELLRLREGEPDSGDAAFGLGLYDYYVDRLPRIVKLLRFFIGLPGGDRERGLAAIRTARETARFHRIEAAAQLYEIDVYYEDEPDRALTEIAWLQERYPHAPLWALKRVEHERVRLGRYATAARLAQDIVDASLHEAPNFGRVTAILGRLALGEAQLLDLRLSEARASLQAAFDASTAAEPFRARAAALLGAVSELSGERAAAEAHYRAALLTTEPDVKERAAHALAHPEPSARVRAVPALARARRAREQGRLRESADAYREALSLWPACAEAQLRVAEDDVREGRPERARAVIADLLRTDAGEPPWVGPWARLVRARLADLDGEREAAVQLYNQVLQRTLGDAALAEEAREGQHRPFRALPLSPRPRATP